MSINAPISFYPAVKLTKLAVAQGSQAQGLGNYLVDLICGIASDAPFAVRLLTVDAVNQAKVLSFYQRVGFMESLSEAKQRQAQKTEKLFLCSRTCISDHTIRSTPGPDGGLPQS